MIKLSENFALREFACKCCGMLKYNPRMELLVEDLEALRSIVGPVTVVSGYRCPKNNTRSGGAVNSRHLQSTAADLSVAGYTPRELEEIVRRVCKHITGIGVGISTNQFHVDVREGPSVCWTYK